MYGSLQMSNAALSQLGGIMRTTDGKVYCNECDLTIAPFAPKIRDEDGDFHEPCHTAKDRRKHRDAIELGVLKEERA